MNSAAKNYFDSGNLLQAEGKLDDAIASYRKALEIQPDSAEVHNQLGEIYFSQGKIAEAIASLQFALKLQPNFAAAYKTFGNALQAQGKLDEAIGAYSKAVELNPEFAEAYANLGSMLSKQGRVQEAIAYFQKAIALKPNFAAIHWNLGNAWMQQGKQDKAIACWQKAAEYKPEQFSAEAFTNQGIYLSQQGKFEAAIGSYQRAIAIQPDFLLAYQNLGNVLQQQNQLDDAIAIFQKAIEIPSNAVPPDQLAGIFQQLGNTFKLQNKLEAAAKYWQQALELQPEVVAAETYNDLGTALGQQGKIEDAIACYRRAIELKPNYPLAHLNLGTLLQQQGQLEEAIAEFRQAIQLNPDSVEAYAKLGNALSQQEKLPDAIAAYRQGVDMQPNSALAQFNLGSMLLQQEKFSEAIAAFQIAIELKPDYAEAYCNQGIALHQQLKRSGQMDLDLFERSLNCFQKAIEINPNLLIFHFYLSDLISNPVTGILNCSLTRFREAADNYFQNCGEIGKFIATSTAINIYLKSGLHQVAKDKFLEIEPQIYDAQLSDLEIITLYTHLVFNLNYLRDNLAENSKLSRFIGKQYVEKIIKPKLTNFANNQPTNSISGQLRIGILSSNFARHSVGWCSADIIQELSKLTPHLYLYSTSKRQPDERTKLFEAASAKFYRLTKLQDSTADAQEILEQIIQDKLDILIGLDSLTVPLQVQILHQKPAPVCLSWLGFEAPFTSEENYFLCDEHTHPSGTEQYYHEQLIRLPDSFVAVAGFECKAIERKAARKAFRLAEDQVVYLCIAPGYKLNPDLIKAQVEILKQVPDSVLMYKGHTGDPEIIQSAYRQECETKGVGFHRIKFLSFVKTEEEHRTIYKIADILLDSYPYNGATHTLEALWFNLPVVTRTGEQYLSRMGYSFLKTLSLSAGIAKTWEEYIEWGTKLGNDTDLRRTIQTQLAQSKQPENLSPLWNPKKFAQDMYGVFEQLLNKQ